MRENSAEGLSKKCEIRRASEMTLKDHEKLLDMAKLYCVDGRTPIAKHNWEKVALALVKRIRALDAHLWQIYRASRLA